MSSETVPGKARMARNNLRKRNIHREEEEMNQQHESSFSGAVVDNEELGDSFRLRSLVPKLLRQCFSGVERDMTQRKLKTSNRKKDQTPVSCSNSELSSSCDRPSNVELRMNDPFVDDNSDVTNLNVSYNTATTVSSNSDSSNLDSEYDFETSDKAFSFLKFRLSYLFVTLVVMLADGLQGKQS